MTIKRDKLVNLTINITDGEHGTVINSSGSGLYLLSNKNIVNGDIVIDDEDREISNLSLEKITKRTKLSKDDIVIATVGSIGRAAIVKAKSPLNFDFQRSVGIIKCDESKLSHEYLYYFLSLPYLQKQLSNKANASVQNCLYISDLEDIEIDYFDDTGYQQKVTSILSAIDKKIELNRQVNAELGQMARTLYDYWFIQFDFPGLDDKPYKSSGCTMKHSTELNRQIPANWGIGTLDDIIARIGTGLNPRTNFKLGQGNNYYVTIKNVDNGKITLDDNCDKIDDEALKIIQKRSNLQVGDILFTSIQPVGVTYYIHETPLSWNINESVFTIRPNTQKVTSEYLYMLLSSEEMKVYTANSSAGSVHKGIRHGVLKDFKVSIPPKELVDDFSERISPILKKIHQNDQQSQVLSSLRDWLLPMLMNGQVTVK